MRKPLISVTMTTYNHEKYIAESIHSILDQTLQDFELVIVNDGSTDNTEQIIKSFHDPRIKYIYQENQGPSACANTALRNSQGKYIALMSGDDVSYPTRLEVQYNEYIKGKPRLLFSHCNLIDDDSKLLEGEHFASSFFNHPNRSREEILRYFFFYGNYLNAVTCFTEKNIFDELGWYDIRLLQLQDFDMWMRGLIHGYEIEIIQQKLIKYRIRSGNQNLSAYRLDSAERILFELTKVYKQFYALDIDNIVSIFPDIFTLFPEINSKKINLNIIDIPYILLKLAFNTDNRYIKYTARDVFFENLTEDYLQYLHEKFSIKNVDFYKYTGWGELFEKIHELEHTRGELEHTRGELNAVYNSYKWQIAVKLEKIARKTGLIYVVKGMLKVYFFVKKTLKGK